MTSQEEEKERIFSIELRSKANLKNVTLANGSPECVLVEGTIGALVQASFAEDVILEVIGKDGTLRINIGEGEITRRNQKDCCDVRGL